mmetsp:Transcript_71706/g.203467  ORF Transcript_71706/g.203467 Transcript_71706/m.203467 type:complete len:230 (-) Transcript_71706:1012-1701(-)
MSTRTAAATATASAFAIAGRNHQGATPMAEMSAKIEPRLSLVGSRWKSAARPPGGCSQGLPASASGAAAPLWCQLTWAMLFMWAMLGLLVAGSVEFWSCCWQSCMSLTRRRCMELVWCCSSWSDTTGEVLRKARHASTKACSCMAWRSGMPDARMSKKRFASGKLSPCSWKCSSSAPPAGPSSRPQKASRLMVPDLSANTEQRSSSSLARCSSSSRRLSTSSSESGFET